MALCRASSTALPSSVASGFRLGASRRRVWGLGQPGSSGLLSSTSRALSSSCPLLGGGGSGLPAVLVLGGDAKKGRGWLRSHLRPSIVPRPACPAPCLRKPCSTRARMAASATMTDRDILPDHVRPSNYALSIRDMDFKTWKYRGTVRISVDVVKPTKEIVLNAHQLVLHEAVLATKSGPLTSTTFSYDEHAHRVTIVLPAEAVPSAGAELAVVFEGTMNNDLAGFYRAKYKPAATPVPAGVPRDDEWHYMFSTQFESCDARRAFPCWDEPNIKASFDFEIEIPEDLVALSNMPVKAETLSSSSSSGPSSSISTSTSTSSSSSSSPPRPGFKMVSFERTPVMSTYLLAWAVGDFEHVEALTERRYNGRQIPVRVYTTRGLKEQGRWALQHAGPIIDYFSEAFGIDYPLPKADLLAVHEFTSGAMENWGLVTYRTTAVLFDDATSDIRYRNRVAYVVAHELAHQWFGNLVTMDWWDELWLNEGFATWVGWHAVDRMHPEWDVWSQFVKEGMEDAFELDGMRSSHPIHVPVRDALEVDQIFDSISYLKGCSAIRMLADHVGVPTFLKGVALYLERHAYGNAKTDALWAAIAEVSGKEVAELMGPWIGRVGYPVVTVAEEPGQISVKQTRFLSSGDPKPEEDQTVWWVPLALTGKKGVDGVAKLSLQKREDTVRDVDDEFYKLNTDAPGFYRVNYPPARLAKLGTQLDRLSTEDKIAITGSAADLAYSGFGTTAALLSFVRGFREETNQLVWAGALSAVGRVKAIFGDDDEPVRKALERYVSTLTADATDRLGFEFKEGEDYLTVVLRKTLIGTAAANGNEGVTAALLKIFDDWVSNPEANPVNPNLRGAVFATAVRTNPARTIPILKKEWFTTRSIDGKAIILSALGSTRDRQLVETQLLPFLYAASPPAPASESVPASDMYMLGASLNRNRHARNAQWEYMKQHWDLVTSKLEHNVLLSRFVEFSLGDFVDAAVAADIRAFFADKDTRAFDRTLATVLDKIVARAMYRERDAAGVREWLAAEGYM